MEVTVAARFPDGMISENYPKGSLATWGMDWKVSLKRPDDAESQALIPAISKSNHEEPYEAARAVPDAWTVVKPAQGKNPAQAERFIFYRGSGNAGANLWAGIDGERGIMLRNFEECALPFQIALRVADGKAAWSRLPELAAASQENNPVRREIPDAWKPLDVVEEELAGVFVARLVEEGLTDDEAKAMVATWRKTWFREPGVRVFSTLPRTIIDRLLPLEITPAPESLARVFVLRSELMEPVKIAGLGNLLRDTSEADGQAEEALAGLELGRFGQGYLSHVTSEETNRMSLRFHALKEKKSNKELTLSGEQLR